MKDLLIAVLLTVALLGFTLWVTVLIIKGSLMEWDNIIATAVVAILLAIFIVVMFFDEAKGQWLTRSEPFFGMKLAATLVSKGVEVLPAGTVMVFGWGEKAFLMFQTLVNIPLRVVRSNHLIGFEAGSVVFLDSPSKVVPTLRFRDCRIPNILEFATYEKARTV